MQEPSYRQGRGTAGWPGSRPISIGRGLLRRRPADKLPAMAAREEDLFNRFDELGIETSTVRHPPVFSVEDNREQRGDIPGGHCKSLFLKDKKGVIWLIVMLEDGRLDIKSLQQKLGSARLSFGKPELMREVLGVEPGSVTPFSLINSSARDVRVVLDQRMMAEALLNYHPLHNEATTTIAAADLLSFLKACGHTPLILAV